MQSTTRPTTTQQATSTEGRESSDQRPRFAIGHVNLGVADVDQATAFYSNLGMRLIVNMGRAAILELRGGTHLIVHQDNGSVEGSGPAALDLIVDDIHETHAMLAAAGANPAPIKRGHPHDRFTATDPSGNLLVINSNHAMGPV